MRVLSPFMVMAAASCAWAASAVCQSQPPPPPAAAMPAAAPGDASALVARLKQRYQELNSVPVRLTEVFQTRTRSLGNQDVTATGTLITYQLGENARSVLVNSTLNRPAEPGMSAPYSGAAVGRLEWIRNRNGIQVQFQPVSGGSSDPQPVTRIELKAEQLDPQMRAMVTDALATLQTFDLIASRGVTTRREPRNGIENEVISTREPVELAPGIRATLEFWIGPRSVLVNHMEATYEVQIPGQEKAFIDYSSDFYYEFEVAIQPGFFTLPPETPPVATAPPVAPVSPARVQDVTPLIQRDRDYLLQRYQR